MNLVHYAAFASYYSIDARPDGGIRRNTPLNTRFPLIRIISVIQEHITQSAVDLLNMSHVLRYRTPGVLKS